VNAQSIIRPELVSADTVAALRKGRDMLAAYDRMVDASIAHDDLAYRKARDDFERAKAK
jgi:hypothetical protein